MMVVRKLVMVVVRVAVMVRSEGFLKNSDEVNVDESGRGSGHSGSGDRCGINIGDRGCKDIVLVVKWTVRIVIMVVVWIVVIVVIRMW